MTISGVQNDHAVTTRNVPLQIVSNDIFVASNHHQFSWKYLDERNFFKRRSKQITVGVLKFEMFFGESNEHFLK